MKNGIYLSFLCGWLFINCGGSGSSSTQSAINNNDTVNVLNITPAMLEPLIDGTLKLKGKEPFGDMIELNGEQIIIDSLIIKPSEVEMVIKDNILVLKNMGSSVGNIGLFTLLRLPDMHVIKSVGSRGQGPDEFMYPHLCRNTNPAILATVVETTKGTIYDILSNGSLIPNPIRFPPKSKGISNYLGEYPSLKNDTILYYAANSSTGKSIFTLGGTDSIRVSEIQNLALDPKRKGWANYIGDFAINMEQTRMVYAYKYFKIVRFFDLEHQTVRTLNFEREEFDENSKYVVNGLDFNITHYWGICAGEKYVYILYSGRTPVQVYNENNKGKYCIYMEKYDWNGQPVAKYKLDQWGYFTVDEKNNILYLVSNNHDDPFFKYQL